MIRKKRLLTAYCSIGEQSYTNTYKYENLKYFGDFPSFMFGE